MKHDADSAFVKFFSAARGALDREMPRNQNNFIITKLSDICFARPHYQTVILQSLASTVGEIK
jgi:hypothetical protein